MVVVVVVVPAGYPLEVQREIIEKAKASNTLHVNPLPKVPTYTYCCT